jgi:hypothetical protein
MTIPRSQSASLQCFHQKLTSQNDNLGGIPCFLCFRGKTFEHAWQKTPNTLPKTLKSVLIRVHLWLKSHNKTAKRAFIDKYQSISALKLKCYNQLALLGL